MREKIARVSYGHPDWDTLPIWIKDKWIDQADDILDALMEPTREMELGGSLSTEGMDGELRPSESGHVFRAMIQAARDGK